MKTEVWAKWFPWLVIAAFALWFTELATFSISIDDEIAAFRTSPDVWIAQGRWTTFLIEKFFFPIPSIPFFSNALFCMAVAASYLLVMNAQRITVDWPHIAFFPLFAALPTWMYISEFYSNLPATAAGLLLCSIAIFLSSKPSSLKNAALQILMLTLAIGAYQTFVFLFVAMVIGQVLSSPSVALKEAVPFLARGAGTTIAAIVLYYIILKSFQTWMGIETGYVNEFYNPQLLAAHPTQTFSTTAVQAINVYFGSPSIYGVSLYSLVPLLCLGIVGITLGSEARLLSLALLLILLLVPFAMNVASGQGIMPIRSLVAVPYVIWLIAISSLRIPRIRAASLIIVGIVTIQIVYSISVHGASTQLALARDKLVASQIDERIVAMIPNFDRTKTYKIDFFGALQTSLPYPITRSSAAGRSFFEWDGGNRWRIANFMKLMGFTYLRPVSQNEGLDLIPVYETMPKWPADGSVRLVDGIVAVKLGDEPGSTHMRHTK